MGIALTHEVWEENFSRHRVYSKLCCSCHAVCLDITDMLELASYTRCCDDITQGRIFNFIYNHTQSLFLVKSLSFLNMKTK